MTSLPTTRTNPGAFTRPAPDTLRRVTSRVLTQVRARQWRGAWHALMAGSANIANGRLQVRRAPRVVCDCCGYVGYAFQHKSNRLRVAWQSACPQCNSRARHRGLAQLLPRLLANGRVSRMLHVAPEPILQPVILRARPDLVYHTCDLYLQDVDFPGEDLTRLSFASGSYDLLLCNHVLEHIERDDLAVAEMARVLDVGGMAVITVPGEWDRRETVVFPDTTLNGHYRDYGLDVVALFQMAFAAVETLDLRTFDAAPDGRSRGIRQPELVFICRKGA